MKLFLAILIAVFVSVPAVADTITLDRDLINLGRLSQPERSPGELTVQVLRNQSTPEEVKLKVTYDYEARECARWDQDRYYVPGRCRDVWNGRRWNRVCSPGHWEVRTVCTGYRDVVRSASEDFELDFEKAATLENGRTEEFELTFVQQGFRSADVDASARVLASDTDYQIKNRGDKLVFKAQ